MVCICHTIYIYICLAYKCLAQIMKFNVYKKCFFRRSTGGKQTVKESLAVLKKNKKHLTFLGGKALI